jgi:hypothetical protein
LALENRRGVNMKRSLLAVLLAIPLLLVAPSVALGAVTETERLKNETETFIDSVPCLGGRARITITYNAVFHFTENDNGSHFTGTIAGTVVANPLQQGVPTYRGHFTQWFGENRNRTTRNDCFTFNANLKANDGSRLGFHITGHSIRNRNGLAVEFEKFRCR